MKEDKRTPGFSKEVLNQAVKASVWLQIIDNVTGKDYYASGVCIDPSGVILTAGHLFHSVIGVVTVSAYLQDKCFHKISAIEQSTTVDAAVIKLREVSGLPYVRMSTTELPAKKDGHDILIAGYRFDGKKYGSIVMTGKAVPGKGTDIVDSKHPEMTYADMYKFSIGRTSDNMEHIKGGLSGSALLTPNGEVVGITKGLTFNIFPDQHKNTAYGIAVKSTRIKEELSL